MSPRQAASEEQLSFDDLFGGAPEPAPAPRRLLGPAEAAARCGLAAEVSSAGLRKPVAEAYPAPDLLARFAAAGVPFTTASDAHRLGRVAERGDELRSLLAGVGCGTLQAYRGRSPRTVALG